MTISCLRLEGFWRFMQNYRDSPILPSFLPSFLQLEMLWFETWLLFFCVLTKTVVILSPEKPAGARSLVCQATQRWSARQSGAARRGEEDASRLKLRDDSNSFTYISFFTYLHILTSSKKTQLTRLKLWHDHNSFTYVPTHIVPWHLPH